MAGTAGTFTSCKDYDDDIKDLQGQLDKKASLDELNSKVSALETSIAEAKTEASKKLFKFYSKIILWQRYASWLRAYRPCIHSQWSVS